MPKKPTKSDKLRARLIEVWKNFVEYADGDALDGLRMALDEWLDDLAGSDFFGTEAQNDPRGDGRDKQPRI